MFFSRALSATDLKNAGYAIKVALMPKTPDDASFVWPPKPSREQALFEVRFVAGASQGCRRYIVTVTEGSLVLDVGCAGDAETLFHTG